MGKESVEFGFSSLSWSLEFNIVCFFFSIKSEMFGADTLIRNIEYFENVLLCLY